MAREDVRRWLRRVAPRTRRFGSVCTGAFVLAAAGLLDGRRVATHWASCQRLADKFPALTVDADALYVVDGKVWTSAGVTTGIDMALALVEADLGAATANLIARHFVLYARRPGRPALLGAARPGLRAPLRHGAVAVPRDARDGLACSSPHGGDCQL